ncbi:MAG: glutathione S-transferase family protein [Methyloceanibacter sp.]
MITLYTFGPALGLPDPSPFVTKAELLLKMAGVPYKTETGGMGRAPKGKLPYIVDDGETVADSTFIRWHLEKKYNIDFDRGLDPEQRAVAWAFEKLLEDNLYWAVVYERWMDEANFVKGPLTFFRSIPAPVRPFVAGMIRRQIRRYLHGQGMGRHSRAEIMTLGAKAIDATATLLGTKPYMMGAEPTGLDATAFPFVAGVLCPEFDTPLRAAAERHDNLKSYVARMMDRYYPGLGAKEGQGTAAA